MQQKPKRSKTGIIIVAVCVLIMIAGMIIWSQYEAKNKDRLEASLLTSDTAQLSTPPPVSDSEPVVQSKRTTSEDPSELLTIAEKALADEDYFAPNEEGKGFHVYFLLKKCLNCSGDVEKVAVLAKKLKERSDEGYGPWHVDSSDMADLNSKIQAAQQM